MKKASTDGTMGPTHLRPGRLRPDGRELVDASLEPLQVPHILGRRPLLSRHHFATDGAGVDSGALPRRHSVAHEIHSGETDRPGPTSTA